MRRFTIFLMTAFIISSASAFCDYSPELFDWTNRTPLILQQWQDSVIFGANITGFYVAMGRENLHLKFEIEERERVNENLLYVFRMNLNSQEKDYFEISLQCDEIIKLIEKPRIGATINWTLNPNWNTVKNNNFNISIQQEAIELSISLEFLGNPTGIHGFNMMIYSGTQKENDLWYPDFIDLCLMTGLICGNDICEEGEDDNRDMCRYCPWDCPGLELTCPLGEPISDWSKATVLDTNQLDDVWKEESNGTDLVALKAEVDNDYIYLKIDLDPRETPHENVTYVVRFNPWAYDVEYMDIKIDCQGVYEFVEKRGEFVSPTNHTSNPAWDSIKNNFTASLTEHSVEIAVPWYALYYPDGTGINVWSSLGETDMNHMSASLESIISLFVSSCGDGTCSAEESDPSNRYQFCKQDCPDAPEPLCGNRQCDLGEDIRWSTSQCIDDCWTEFGGEDKSPYSPGDSENPFFTIMLIIFILIGLITGVSAVGRRILKRLTAGRRKFKDLEKRVREIELEQKDLQKKFMETRISEEEFKEKMDSLEREMQNIHLELKEKRK